MAISHLDVDLGAVEGAATFIHCVASPCAPSAVDQAPVPSSQTPSLAN